MRKADNLPPTSAVVTKSGDLNFPEPSGLVQACNGTALSFSFYFKVKFNSLFASRYNLSLPSSNFYGCIIKIICALCC